MISQLFKLSFLLLLSINIHSQVVKNVNGFSGTDTLEVKTSDISKFNISYNESINTLILIDEANNIINASNFEYFNFNSVTYRFIYDGYDYVSQEQSNNGTSSDISNGQNNRISHALISNDGTKVFLYSPSDNSYTNYTIPSATAFGTPSNLSGVAVMISCLSFLPNISGLML
mgnify:CR=1 FL=1